MRRCSTSGDEPISVSHLRRSDSLNCFPTLPGGAKLCRAYGAGCVCQGEGVPPISDPASIRRGGRSGGGSPFSSTTSIFVSFIIRSVSSMSCGSIGLPAMVPKARRHQKTTFANLRFFDTDLHQSFLRADVRDVLPKRFRRRRLRRNAMNESDWGKRSANWRRARR